MTNKEFYKRFEEMLKDIFGDKNKPTTPMGSFMDNVSYEDFTNDLGEWKKTIRTSKDGLYTSIHYVLNGDSKWSSGEKNEIKDLQRQLEKCVRSQEFEKAVELRDKIKYLEKESSKINQLKKEMEIAIKDQNFERAIEIRDELKKIN